jgi:peptide chain release factor 1
MSIIVEIHAAEGGEHARLLVCEQLGIYGRLCTKRGWQLELVESKANLIICRVSGPGAEELFSNESGGHRFQQVRSGRVQTSTITIAVLKEPTEVEIHLDAKDLEITCCRGSGPGGQKRNMTDSAVQIKYKPTGLFVRIDTEKSQHQNKAAALALLRARLWEARQKAEDATRAADRKAQQGCGARGDKRRTIRYQDDQVKDHIDNRRWRLQDYLKGDWK